MLAQFRLERFRSASALRHVSLSNLKHLLHDVTLVSSRIKDAAKSEWCSRLRNLKTTWYESKAVSTTHAGIATPLTQQVTFRAKAHRVDFAFVPLHRVETVTSHLKQCTPAWIA